MRLVQKSLMHTGYIIFRDNTILPSFSTNIVEETYMRRDIPAKAVKRIYAVSDLSALVSLIDSFKEEHGIIPQNYTEELRTGFRSGSGLNQTPPKFCYC